MNGIVWLASYPKSGNTWLRVFLSNFMFATDGPVEINNLPLNMSPFAHRALADRIAGLETSDLKADEIDLYRADACRRVAMTSTDPPYFKIHDAYLLDSRGEALIPADATRGAVYVARNPLDVAISFAHHMSCSIDETIERMASPDFALSATPDRLHRMLPQRILSWSRHVGSWLDQKRFPVHLMRYEDMLGKPLETFGGCLRFLSLDDDVSRIRQALEWSSFESLRKQEADRGFRERPPKVDMFFRNGRSQQWRECLTQDQISKVIEAHGDTMRKLGYV